MKIALLQCNMVTGDIHGNARRMLQAVRRAEDDGARLCISPELALCGIAPQQLLFTEGFVDACQAALQELATELATGPAVLVGAPVGNTWQGDGRFSNAAVLIHNGKHTVVSRKVYMGGASPCLDATYFERGISCGVITVFGWRCGVVICEENAQGNFWKVQHAHVHNPLMELVSRGVDCIVQLAAAPFAMGRQAYRENMLSHVAARHHVHVVSANMVGGNDGVIYAGQSLAFDPTGKLLARGRAFEEDTVLVDTATSGRAVARPCESMEEECWNALVLGTRDYVHKSGVERVLIGLSGGIDSALVAAIAVRALGKKHVEGVFMPSPFTSEDSAEYTKQLVNNLGITCKTLPIAPLMQAFATALQTELSSVSMDTGDVTNTTQENIQARIRGMLLMTLANHHKALVLNTSNKSEIAVGYSTLYGDMVGAVSVLGDVSKTMVYRLATWYNQQEKRKNIPEGILLRSPTAELRPGQKDSDNLPTYDVLDSAIARILGDTGLEGDIQEKTVMGEMEHDIFAKICAAEFKRRQVPLALRVTAHAFGQEWVIPVITKRTYGI